MFLPEIRAGASLSSLRAPAKTLRYRHVVRVFKTSKIAIVSGARLAAHHAPTLLDLAVYAFNLGVAEAAHRAEVRRGYFKFRFGLGHLQFQVRNTAIAGRLDSQRSLLNTHMPFPGERVVIDHPEPCAQF